MITKIKWKKPFTREAWLAQRKELQGLNNLDVVRFGSSDLSTILNENAWQSSQKLFKNHLGEYLTDIPSYKLQMGLMFEEANRLSFECFTTDKEDFNRRFVHQDRVRVLESPKYFLLNSKYPHSFSSLDFIMKKGSVCPFTGELIGKNVPVETKFVNYNAYASWKRVVPDYYYAQVQHQMMMMNTTHGYLSVIAGGDYYDCFRIERDEEFITRADEALTDWQLRLLKSKRIKSIKTSELAKPFSEHDLEFLGNLEKMLTDLEPELIGTKADLDFYEDELYPYTNGNEMVGCGESQKLIDKYLKANKIISKLEDVKAESRCKLVDIMEDFEILKTDTNKVINRRGIEGKKNYFSIK